MSYFALASKEEIPSLLLEKIRKFYTYKQKTGDVNQWIKSYNLYFGRHINGNEQIEVEHVGEDSELSAFGVNHYRNLIKHLLALTTSSKPTFDYRAVNTDLKSIQQAKLADNIIDSYMVEKRLGRSMKLAAEIALALKIGYIYMPWDLSLGKEIAGDPVYDENGNPVVDDDGDEILKIVHEGDVNPKNPMPWEVIHDHTLREWTQNKWIIVKGYENKYDLGNRYPLLKEKIEKCSNEDEFGAIFKRITSKFVDEGDSDLIPVYEFYHLPTDSIPSGRYVKFINSELPLFDGAYPYKKKKLPVHRITPGELFNSCDGYSDFYDIMVLQQVANVLYSTIFTNQQAFGVQAIWAPDGCNLSVEEIGKGLVFLKGGPPGSQPVPLQLTATPAEIFKNIDYIERAAERISGINATVRGTPEASLKSSVALGRMQAMAIQYASNFQQSWAELQEDSGTWLLYLLQDYANTERMIAMGGKANRGAMASFTGKDIELIDRVVCDLGNYQSRTPSGRQELAEFLVEKGLIKDVTSFMQVLQSGNVDPMFESPMSKLELIRKENETLMDGKKVRAMVGDSHIQHVQEHRVILDDPTIREAADRGDELALQVVMNVQDHIMEHKMLQQTQDPFWFVVSGEQPPPMPMPPPNGQPPSNLGPGPQGSGLPNQVGDQNTPEPPPIPELPPEVKNQ